MSRLSLTTNNPRGSLPIACVVVIVWWFYIVFFHNGKSHMLLKVGAPGHTHTQYSVCILKTAVLDLGFSLWLYSLIYLSVSLGVYFAGLFSGSGGGKGQLFDTDVETGNLIHMIKKAHRLDKVAFFL